MRNILIAATLALSLAACGPKAEPKVEETPAASTSTTTVSAIAALPDPTGACAATATHTWTPQGATAGYTITGAAAGPTCNTGEAVITVRNAAGKVLLSQGGHDVGVMSNTVFSMAVSPESLKAAVADWVSSAHADDATGQLPEWKPGDAQPTSGEFPFYPEEGMTQAQYGAIRAANKPMFCHVQGGESMACYAVDGDVLTKVGLQSFPG